MKETRAFLSDPMYLVLVCLLAMCVVSLVVILIKVGTYGRELSARQWEEPPQKHMLNVEEVSPSDLTGAHLEHTSNMAIQVRGLFASELRVVAIGSAYPIPYDAEVCPFTSIPQPTLNQLDRDGDGMTDDWENKYGLDKYDAADARADFDKDGFTNEEEFRGKSNPADASSHPPYVLKLRFVKLLDVPFPLVFQGSSTLADGQTLFQINTPADGRTHFLSLGETLKGITLERYVQGDTSSQDRLFVRRGDTEIELPRGKKMTDPESKAELINILDHSREKVTMCMLLSVNNEEYTVTGVYHDRVVVKSTRTEKVFDIVGLDSEEREELLRESE